RTVDPLLYNDVKSWRRGDGCTRVPVRIELAAGTCQRTLDELGQAVEAKAAVPGRWVAEAGGCSSIAFGATPSWPWSVSKNATPVTRARRRQRTTHEVSLRPMTCGGRERGSRFSRTTTSRGSNRRT